MKKRLLGFAGYVLVTMCGLAQSAQNSPDSIQPRLGEILARVEAATKPPKGYRAAVHQTVMRAGGVELLAEEDYAVGCTDSGETRATKQLSSKRAAEKTPAAASPGAAPTVRGGLLTVNPLRAMQHVAAMASQEIVDDLHQGVPCYRISATDNQYGFVLWVAKADASVRRLVVRQGPGVVYDTTFEYKHWNGLLVPSHVEITNPSSGTTVAQDFSGHAF